MLDFEYLIADLILDGYYSGNLNFIEALPVLRHAEEYCVLLEVFTTQRPSGYVFLTTGRGVMFFCRWGTKKPEVQGVNNVRKNCFGEHI